MSNLVSTKWLYENLAKVVVLDGSWHLPQSPRKAYQEYLQNRIKGARFFDIDNISDKTSPLPHMLPSPEQFSRQMGELGIKNSDHVVVYDALGLGPACRVFWTFKVFGHDQVSVLNGGLPKWALQYPVESGEPLKYPVTDYKATFQKKMVVDLAEINRVLTDKSKIVLDARPEKRFKGIDPEPRPGIPSGHMPGSVNVPAPSIINSDGTLKEPSEILKAVGQTEKPLIVSCGSGVMACVVHFGLKECGIDSQVYDGSWSEYAAVQNAVIERQ